MKKPQIIYVENEQDDVDLLRRMLEKSEIDADLISAPNEQQFVSELTERCPDLVLSDNKIPGFGALNALRLTREKCGDVSFICVSGLVPEKEERVLREAGALCCLSKDNL